MTIKTLIDRARLQEFCERWGVSELSLFGSVLRDDFRQESDIDILVAFAPWTRATLLDLVAMKEELETLFGRPVDLVTRHSIEESRNPIRRAAILDTAERVV